MSKLGRNKQFCQAYRSQGREEANRKRRIARHERWQMKKRKKLLRRAA